MWLKGAPPELKQDHIKRILMIQLGDIGDVVLSLPCVRALKERFPHARVVVAFRAKARNLIELCPWADEVISIEQPRLGPLAALRYQIAFFRRLRAFHFDLVFDLRAGTRGAILARASGAPMRIGFYSNKETFWRNAVFTHLKLIVSDPNRHQSRHYQSLLVACGIRVRHPHPHIVPSTAHRQAAERLLKDRCMAPDSLIAVHPFSLWRYKEWPLEKTAELVRKLTDGTRMTALILGAPAERERAQSIVDRCHGGAVNLAGETTLPVLAAVLQRVLLLIGMDSAAGHLSAAVSTPCITIFGPGKPGVWSPLGEENRIVHKAWPCIHCGQKGCDTTERARCLEELSVAEVFAVVEAHIIRIRSMRSPRPVASTAPDRTMIDRRGSF